LRHQQVRGEAVGYLFSDRVAVFLVNTKVAIGTPVDGCVEDVLELVGQSEPSPGQAVLPVDRYQP